MNRSELKEIVRQELQLTKGKSSEINEASEVEIKDMDKKAQLSIKYWAKALEGKPTSAWDGIHGLIVNIKVQSVFTMRVRYDKIKYLAKGPEFRWIEFDKGKVSVGF